MGKWQFLVHNGMVGCLPDCTDCFDTLTDAKLHATKLAADVADDGYPVTGNARRVTMRGGVAYTYGRTGQFYIEIMPVPRGWSEGQ